jgi:formylglycine-generating enzyme required for sulfatase activity
MIFAWKPIALAFLLLSGTSQAAMVLIPGGSYLPFFENKSTPGGSAKGTTKPQKREPVAVSSFWLDQYPVTNQDYLEFVRAKPEWRRSRIEPIFSDGHYLEEWSSDLALRGNQDRMRPVTFVSWFAAEAYCEWKGKELPTVDQWEYAASDRGRGRALAEREILAWYSRSDSKPPARVGSTRKNGFDVYDLFGLIWEWTLDFNSGTQGNEARDGGTKDAKAFCGSGSLGALDSTDYASFMRFSFRNSLKANYTIRNLGFRCAKEVTS